jgi:poly [ADP-ribose] polymerase
MAAKIDSHCPIAKQAKIVGEWDCMLNQTNIGHNNNKFYVIQMLKKGSEFFVWTRWGRVGEDGQNALKGPFSDQGGGEKEFKSKFRSKTKNKWEDRENFTPASGKYTLIDIDTKVTKKVAAEREDKIRASEKTAPKGKTKVKPSQLDPAVQKLVSLIFDHKVMQGAMADLDIDVNKAPLGQLSDKEVKLGAEVLEELEDQLNKSKPKANKLEELSSHFYTVIPHSFGRSRPPVISDLTMLQVKKDMLNILLDIQDALNLHKQAQDMTSTVANPLDQQYATLKTTLKPLKTKSDDFKMIEAYIAATAGGSKPKIMDAFEIDRAPEGKRFAEHDKLDHRKLLWHGTNVAVIAPICKSGLRIMPHAGGRVGKGLYFASEQSKSAGYTGRSGRTGIMFLVEAALGKEHHILHDNWRLKAPPSGKHSIVAKGRTEPDEKKNLLKKFEGHDVIVPQGKPQKMKEFSKSSFWQSEYLVYKESQARIRYLLKLSM